MVKLTVNPKNDYAVRLSEEFLLLKPHQAVHMVVELDMTKLQFLRTIEHYICGYMLVKPDSERAVQKWLLTEKMEKKSQQAFKLAVRLSSDFSAFDTVIDLPGNALLESRIGKEEDFENAHELASQTELVQEMKKKKKTGANDWLSNLIGASKQAVSQWAWGPQELPKEQQQAPVSTYLMPELKKQPQKAGRSSYVVREMNEVVV